MKRIILVVSALLCGACAWGKDVWQGVPTGDVQLGGELGRRFAITLTNNFLKIDHERDFFKPFREKKAESGFIGLGKEADAAVYLARQSGDPAAIALKEKIIATLVTNQLPDGYIGYLKPESRMNKLWDMHEIGFILQGLVSDWELFGNRAARDAAERTAEYVMRHWGDLHENWEFDFITDREWTLGLGHGFIRLYQATHNPRYLDFVLHERALRDWNAPITIGRGKMIYGQAYGYLGTCLEQLEIYAEDADPAFLRPSFRALDFMLHGEGLLVNGTGGIAECWTDDQDGSGAVGESCMLAFQMLWYDRLLRLGVADTARLGDLMERLVVNALPAAQSPDGRKIRYYTPLNGNREYFASDTYCCPNNYRRMIGRLGGYVYYTKDRAMLVNLFTASQAKLTLGKVQLKVVCETDFPTSGRITYRLDPGEKTFFSFQTRLPSWCATPVVKVNGTPVTYPVKPGELLVIPRVWKPGDNVVLDFPMPVRCVRGRKRQSGRFCVMRGPLLYALDTRTIPGKEKTHPLDAANDVTLDPRQLTYLGAVSTGARPHGTAISARCATSWGVVAVPESAPEVKLVEFADPCATLTYFRAPDINESVRQEDELFQPQAAQ